MTSSSRNKTKGLGRGLLWIAQAPVVLYVVLDAIVIPIFRPLTRWLARLRLVTALEGYIAQLPPLVILILLLVPFLSAEPAKVYALYLMGTGHLATGVTMFVGAYIVSLVLVEHIYHAGKAKLRTLPWFAKVTDWLFDLRDRLVAWMKSTPAWATFKRLGDFARGTIAGWRQRWAAWFSASNISKP
jgi:hypothetical protein